MKQTYLLITLLTVGLIACESNNSTENKIQTLSEQALEKIEKLPDTILTSKNMKENEFQADLSKIVVNTKLTALLDGEWITQNGEIEFLRTNFEIEDKVIFQDSLSTLMSGWGAIKFNRSAKFYTTESSSYIYEYYVLGENILVLTEYDYRNDDLTMKEKPDPIKQELNIEFINDDQIKISNENQIIELKRKNTTANST